MLLAVSLAVDGSADRIWELEVYSFSGGFGASVHLAPVVAAADSGEPSEEEHADDDGADAAVRTVI